MAEEDECYVSAMHHWIISCPKQAMLLQAYPRWLPYMHSNRPDLDAVYMFDLKIVQAQGLKFYRNYSFSIIL